ncbi:MULTISPECIES: LacI family DNA-binding transcriptional regulator [unclassified Ornithinimicrobium]|uniref:LacI family DNA-binding transcriptional regulator n=1 Tax=unclassified Ornithinimicrobium TaxID=2615080 RepID=UPI0038547554
MDGHAGRVTMYDVARHAGVSHQTVSRVINGAAHVAPPTKERVREAMRLLGYRPSASARNLAARRSRAVGVVTFIGPYFGPGSTLLSIEVAARSHGYSAHISSLAGLGPVDARAALEDLLQRDVEGLMVVAPTDEQAELVASVLPHELPVLALEARLTGRPLVASDNELGGALAAEHLITLGHTRIGHAAGPLDWSEARLRTVGWERVLREHELEPGPRVDGDWSARSGYEAGVVLAGSGVSAVFAANDQMALGLLTALHERGIRVPEDISVVGYDNTPDSGWYFPPLTTVEQEFREVGAVGITQLLALVEGRPVEAQTFVPPALVVRRSTAPPLT